ncbi:tetratricopeptide repeat protein [Desulfofundulus thermosubterraneus]|uniref:Anaphase-promoting complex, cyclosome, subunit 3 n=1 Tax=Desulfofundulus thermosubterraneus DSM 16057 TaxID=1121432 RepID=A0A1M6GZX0_9FIRM|nr:tetratricopeptide repeat protein [Desulfofundulus thermosubterraneus]SHJ15444.1 Anaphase-promoting complex, cyclosome, subunit 3 [Desulfofundulus thermosubterraneus DSM 16057]
MKRKTRLFLSALTLVIFLFGTIGTAFGMGKKDHGRMDNTGVGKELQESSTAEDVYQHRENRDFEVKTRTNNDGDEFQVKVEERLGREITEGIEDEELTKPGAKGLEGRIAELERKLAENPGDQKLLWKLAVAYRNTGEYDKAIETLKELEGQLPHPTAKVAVLLAQCLKAKGDKEAALAELEKLLESPAATVPGAVYAYEGILKEELGKVKEAVGDVEKAIAAEPKDKDLYRKAGELYSKAGEKGIKVFVKGRKLAFDTEPFVANGRTMVPVRAIAEALGLDVNYEDGAVVITNPASGKTVTLYLGRSEAEAGGRKVTLDVPAQVVPPGRTVIPLRFVSENLGADVNWVEDGQVVAVN